MAIMGKHIIFRIFFQPRKKNCWRQQKLAPILNFFLAKQTITS